MTTLIDKNNTVVHLCRMEGITLCGNPILRNRKLMDDWPVCRGCYNQSNPVVLKSRSPGNPTTLGITWMA